MKCLKTAVMLIFLLIAAIITVELLETTSVYADTQNNVSATVKISVCGNVIIENGEDCEGNDLNSQTCESIGYGPGALSCDIACSFDISNCSTPTPTPTSTSMLTLTPTPTPSNTTSSSSSNESSVTPTSIPTPTSVTFFLSVVPNILESYVAYVNDEGRIKTSELFNAVKSWVDDWKEVLVEKANTTSNETLSTIGRKCDLDNNGECDIKDLSILLFYIER